MITPTVTPNGPAAAAKLDKDMVDALEALEVQLQPEFLLMILLG